MKDALVIRTLKLANSLQQVFVIKYLWYYFA